MWKYIIIDKSLRRDYEERLTRRALRDFSDPLSIPENAFVQRYRLSKEAFLYLLRNLNLPAGTRSTYIPPVIRLAVALLIFATGGYQNLARNDFLCPMSKGSISLIFSEVLFYLEENFCRRWIKINQLENSKILFFERYKIPGVVGCIDGTHIYILKPREDEFMFCNRKGKHSLNVMIICDYNLRIMALNARYGGAAHDSFVWGESNERKYFQDLNRSNPQSWLLGDSGYPLEPWLITPYRNPKDRSELKFNDVHARARSTVERCIGIYKGVWRILSEERRARYTPNKVASIANVCAALHNIRIHFKVSNNNITPFSEEQSPPEIVSDVEFSSTAPVRRHAERLEKILNQQYK